MGSPSRGPLRDRLLAKRQIVAGCWVWTGARNDRGYGQLRVNNKVQYVHRLAYEHFVGTIPEGLEMDHLCRTRACFNPEHLEPVTSAENTRRGEPAQRTFCPAGHPYDESNTRKNKNGRRSCRKCHSFRVSTAKTKARRLRGPILPIAECKNGHAYNDANTYVDPKGHRHCRACKREFMRNNRKAAKA